jgi:hypothetical protein
MSHTRFSNDVDRQNKQFQEQTGSARWVFDRPGPGTQPAYQEDVFIRVGWGGNMWSNSTDLSSYLSGRMDTMDRHIGVDSTPIPSQSTPLSYPVSDQLYTDQVRTTQPAWLLRGRDWTVDTSTILGVPAPITDRLGINVRRFGR